MINKIHFGSVLKLESNTARQQAELLKSTGFEYQLEIPAPLPGEGFRIEHIIVNGDDVTDFHQREKELMQEALNNLSGSPHETLLEKFKYTVTQMGESSETRIRRQGKYPLIFRNTVSRLISLCLAYWYRIHKAVHKVTKGIVFLVTVISDRFSHLCHHSIIQNTFSNS